MIIWSRKRKFHEGCIMTYRSTYQAPVYYLISIITLTSIIIYTISRLSNIFIN
jgi:hypothetical protein